MNTHLLCLGLRIQVRLNNPWTDLIPALKQQNARVINSECDASIPLVFEIRYSLSRHDSNMLGTSGPSMDCPWTCGAVAVSMGGNLCSYSRIGYESCKDCPDPYRSTFTTGQHYEAVNNDFLSSFWLLVFGKKKNYELDYSSPLSHYRPFAETDTIPPISKTTLTEAST